MHRYRVDINGGAKRNRRTFWYRKKEYGSIYMKKGAASFEFESRTLFDVDDLVHCGKNVFGEALRKVYFIHILMFERGVEFKNIKLCIDKQTYHFDSANDYFPFMNSIVPEADVDLNGSFVNLITPLLETSKTERENDYRFRSLNSLILAKTRDYEIDEFSNAWTSFNSLYGGLAEKFNKYKAENNKNLFGKRRTSDLNCQAILMCPIDKRFEQKNGYDTEELWKNYFVVDDYIRCIDELDYVDIYRRAEERAKAGILETDNELIAEIENHFSCSLFTVLLLLLPYRLRCFYFHGGACLPLFESADSIAIKKLQISTYFLERFIVENLCNDALFTITDEKFAMINDRAAKN